MYEAVIRVPAPVIKIVHGDQLNSDTIIVSSPHKFMDGGRAMLERFARSHHVAIRGKIVWAPRVNSRVRLCVRS